jgi:hypothetical protein
MAHIDLNRTFVEWTTNEKPSSEYLRMIKGDRPALGWDDILEAKRAVILAEGGAGKSTEFREQCRTLRDKKQFAFLLTVKKAGENGVENSLKPAQRTQLQAWRSSNDTAWFFLDSIDEAKGASVSLRDALDQLAETIEGAGFRARIIFSCRPSDWEFRKDLDLLVNLLPSPEHPPELDDVDFNQNVVQIFRQKKDERNGRPSGPLVAFMAPLDKRQIRLFADGHSIQDVRGFLAALSEFDLWTFASRPLDLSWLAQHWAIHQKFERLEEMLSVNLVERLRETDSERARKLQIEPELAMMCLERVGAALVLSRQQDISVADGEINASTKGALRLDQVLGDLAPAKLTDFLSSAVFVAAGLGVIRLHNDNDGVVRSYLAARWMLRALRNQCQWIVARDLIFAQSHGCLVVKPSMLSTAVWLSLWDARVANMLVERQPFALLDSGDPSSLSLDIRRQVLRAVLATMESSHQISFLSNEGLRRFAQLDLEAEIKSQWDHCGPSSRAFLLQLIREGKLHGCASLAFDAATSPLSDSLISVLAAQAIDRAGNEAMRSQFAAFLRRRAMSMDPEVLWNAIDCFAPQWFSADDVIAALPVLLTDRSTVGAGIDVHGPALAKRICNASDAAKLLAALLPELPTKVDNAQENDFDRISPLMPTVAELANRIVELDGPSKAIQIAVDALLRLTATRRDPDWRGESVSTLKRLMRQTKALRQAVLWRFSETFDAMGWAAGTPLTHSWQIDAAQLSLGLTLDDIDWLLDDIGGRQHSNDKLLALNLTMWIWRQEGRPESALQRVKNSIGNSEEFSKAVAAWTTAPERSTEQIRFDEQNEKHLKANAERREQQDASWIRFAADIRDDPEQLRSLNPPNESGVDARIFHLWQLLDRLNGNHRNQPISDVSLLTPIFGTRPLPFIQEAFVKYWRRGTPMLRCERNPGLANVGNAMESIALVGLSMESSKSSDWAKALSVEEAAVAAVYATLNLNGFPVWFEQLALAQSEAVRLILNRALSPELASQTSGTWLAILESVAKSPSVILDIAAPQLIDHIASPTPLSIKALSLTLRIVVNAKHRLAELLALMLDRLTHDEDISRLAIYMSSAYAIDADAACSSLARLRKRLTPVENVTLAETLLPLIFGGTLGSGLAQTRPSSISTTVLLDLIEFSVETFPLESDRKRPSGVVYSPDSRDDAQRARDASINLLAKREGAPTFAALRHLAGLSGLASIKEWLNTLALTRARLDAETAPWRPRDVVEFEKDFQTLPRTPADLQRAAMARIEDLQHDLIHGDFGQARIVARFEKEVDAQRWLAHELYMRSGRSYSVVREAHSADEKEPDITLTSSGTGAKLPIEIKVAETWTLAQLKEALTVQLMGRYLRDRNAQWGILLIVHCKARAKGWEKPNGGYYTFAELLLELQRLAAEISARDSSGPQMSVCAIDVSSAGANDTAKAQ